MAKPGIWNDNRFRSYPFLAGQTSVTGTGTIENIPHSAVVDAGFTLGLDSGYVAGEHSVWLDAVRREGSTLLFTFKSDAPGLLNKPLVFTRTTTADLYQLEYVDRLVGELNASESASEVSASSESFSYDGDDVCDVQPLWSGFLVTGELSELASLIANNTAWASNVATVEPALISSLVDSYVAHLNVGNADRTRVDGAADCSAPTWPHPTGDIIHINQTCLQGHVRFKAGYNATIEQLDDDNQIIITAEPGAGEGVPGSKSETGLVCDEVPLFAGESPPTGSTLYEGGYRCNEVIRSINGIGGQLLTILDGTGVAITEVPDEHKLIINVDMRSLAVCYNDISEASESV